MMDTPDALLFAVKDYIARAGLPPKNIHDDFGTQSSILGKMPDVSKIAFSSEGELFAVRGNDLYRGSFPSAADQDWFSTARRVGKTDWDTVKFIFFGPQQLLYTATKNGEFFMGPAPSNENKSWLHDEATQIGKIGWNRFDALFFDHKGILYAVTDEDKLVMGSPPTKPDYDWLGSSTTIGDGGWRVLTHFMAVGPDGDLWCVDSKNGNLYKGPIPTTVETNYISKAVQLGLGYNLYSLLSFTHDKTIVSILSFAFLPDSGDIVSQCTEVVYTRIYNNKSSIPLKHTFSFSKTMTDTSTFSLKRGFTVANGSELTFKAGVPSIAEERITVCMGTINIWHFMETNETQSTFSSSADVEVPPHGSIRMVASVTEALMDVPYRAKIRTLFGYTTSISGIWKGVAHYNLMITQEDYNC